MKIKRILAMFLAAFMIASLAACGGQPAPSTPGSSTPAPAPAPTDPGSSTPETPAAGGSITLWTYQIGRAHV